MEVDRLVFAKPRSWRWAIPSPRLEALLLVLLIAACTALLGSAILAIGPTYRRALMPQNFILRAPFAYAVAPQLEAPPFYRIAPDSSSAPARSNLRLYENARELGPAHAPHETIRTRGGGLFSHWTTGAGDDYIVFSTFDNSDPRRNERHYSIRYTAVPGAWLVAAAIFAWLAAAARLFCISPTVRRATALIARTGNGHRFWQAIVLLASIYLGWVLLWLFPKTPIFSSDSETYLLPSVLVSLGYPAFLYLVKGITGSLRWVPAAQFLVFVGAILYLHEASARLFRRPALAGLLALALLAYSPITLTLLRLLTEPLFIALIIVIIAAAFDALSRPGANPPLYLLGAATAALIFVRPAGYFAPLAVVFLALAWRGQFRRVALRAGAPMIGLIVVGIAGGGLVRGVGTQSLGGFALFPHIADLFEAKFLPPDRADFGAAIEADTRPYAGQLAVQPDWRSRYLFATNRFNPLMHVLSLRILKTAAATGRLPPSLRGPVAEWLKTADPAALPEQSRQWVNAEFLDLAAATIAHRPLGYIEEVLRNVVGAWDLCILIRYPAMPVAALDLYRQTEPASHAFVGWAGNDLPAYDSAALISRYPVLTRESLPLLDAASSLLASQRTLIWLTAISSLLAMPAALFFRRGSPAWIALGFVGAMLHGAVVFAAAATVFIPRYALPIDPLVIAALLLAADIALDALHRPLHAARRILATSPAGARRVR